MESIESEYVTQAQSAGRQRFETLDVLRGAAAVAVVVHHVLRCTPGFDSATFWTSPLHNAWWVRWVFLGDMAVTVFFVLSGASLAISARQESGFTAWSFYIKRFFRIYPLYALCIFVYFSFRPVFHLLAPEIRQDWLSPQFSDPVSGATWVAYLTMSFNITGAPVAFNNVLWSLPIEMQFYLFFPLMLGMLDTSRGVRGIALVALFGITMYVAAIVFSSSGNTLNRLWEFAAGMVCGCYATTMARPSSLRWLRGAVLLGVSAILFYAARAGLTLPLLYAPRNFFEACFAVSATLLALHFGEWHAATHLGRTLVRIGVVSYGIYVWHTLALGTWAPIVRQWHLPVLAHVILLLLTTLAFTFAVSEVSYRWFESPLIRRGKIIAARFRGARTL